MRPLFRSVHFWECISYITLIYQNTLSTFKAQTEPGIFYRDLSRDINLTTYKIEIAAAMLWSLSITVQWTVFMYTHGNDMKSLIECLSCIYTLLFPNMHCLTLHSLCMCLNWTWSNAEVWILSRLEFVCFWADWGKPSIKKINIFPKVKKWISLLKKLKTQDGLKPQF